MSRRIQAGGTASKTGQVFAVTLDDAVISWADGNDLRRPMGLYLSADSGPVRVLWTVGESMGGGGDTRRFQVTRSGAWLNADWQTAKLEIEAIPDGARLRWGWTVEQCANPPALVYVETILAGTRAVPRGAFELLPGAADASWAWVTNDGSGALSVPWPLLLGASAPVAGDEYTASAGQTLCWRLFIP